MKTLFKSEIVFKTFNTYAMLISSVPCTLQLFFNVKHSQYMALNVTTGNNRLPLSREDKARPWAVCSPLSRILLQRRCRAGRAENQPRRMCVFDPGHLQCPGKCLQALFVLPQKTDFSQRGCFSKNNKRCYFKLGGRRRYLDRLHKRELAA